MKETEKIEIMHFDQEGYLEDGRNVYEAGKRMTALADRVHEEGYDAVFLMGVGGTWDEFMQLEYLMNKFGDRDLEVYLIHAAEWNVTFVSPLCKVNGNDDLLIHAGEEQVSLLRKLLHRRQVIRAYEHIVIGV